MAAQYAQRRLDGFLKWADERLQHNVPFLDVAGQGENTLDDIAGYVRRDSARAAETVPWLNWFASQLKNNKQLYGWLDERVRKMTQDYACIGNVSSSSLPSCRQVSEDVQPSEDVYVARHLNGFVGMAAALLEKDGSGQARSEALNALAYHGKDVLADIRRYVHRDLKARVAGAVSALNAFSLAVNSLNAELWSALDGKVSSMRTEYAKYHDLGKAGHLHCTKTIKNY